MAQSVLSDGFVSLCISDDANWLGEGCRILIEGQMTDAGSAEPDVITKVNGLRDVAARFGEGSVLSESIRAAMCACQNGAISIYALPRKDATAGVKAEYELTVTGTATSDGRVTIFWGNSDYSISIPVEEGDTPAIIAAAVAAAVSPNFPFTAVADAGVVTLTAKNAGTVGNGLIGIYNWQDRINFAPQGVEMEITQKTQGAGNPSVDVDDYADAIGECCYSCYILSSDDRAWQKSLRDHIRSAWACDKPQCFGHGYVYNSGTLGQVLASGDGQTPELSRMAISQTDPVFPYLKNANFGALSCCIGCDNPEVSIQGMERGVLSCVAQPQTCSAGWAWDEMVQLKDNGFVVTSANAGSGALANPYVHNDVTNYIYDDMGRTNVTWQATASRRLAVSTALSIAEKLQEFNGLSLFTKNTSIKQGVQGTNLRLMRADIVSWARNQEGVLFGAIEDEDEQIRLVSAAEISNGCNNDAGNLLLFFKYVPPSRIKNVSVEMTPQMLENCDR